MSIEAFAKNCFQKFTLFKIKKMTFEILALVSLKLS